MIQVFAAPAVAWRGIFSVHTWIALKPTGAPRFTRYEVVGFGVANGAPAVRIDRMGPDNHWFGARPQILPDRRGAGVDALIEQVGAAVASYAYRPWPALTAILSWCTSAARVPNWEFTFPRMRSVRISCRTVGCLPRLPADLGFRYRFTGSLYGLAGILLGAREGLEVNLLGLSFGIDPVRPALKLAAPGRLGVARL